MAQVYPRINHGGKRLGWTMCLVLPMLVCHMAWAGNVVKLCEDDNYAPFIYSAPDNSNRVEGATAELVGEIFSRLGMPYQITLMPWVRCLAYVADGHYQIAMDAYYDQDRAKDYAFSRPYFTLTPQYYYSRKKYHNGLAIESKSQLKNYQGCGIRGYSYGQYALSGNDLNTDSDDHAALIRKVEYGRCDYFVEELEVMQGFALMGSKYLADSDLGHAAVPDALAPQLHFMLAKSNAQTVLLLPLINQQIVFVQQKHIMQQLVMRQLSGVH
jgi:polar amino acid transport system substrate-binding protein